MYKISVIIPVYNVGLLLNECLYSVVTQSIGIENIQVICIDDASPSRQQEADIQKYWFEKYPKNFVFLKNSENLGQGPSRNKGMKFVKGEYVHFLDADDRIEPNLYLEAYQQMKKTNAQIFRVNCYRNPLEKGKHYVGNCSQDRLMTSADKTRALFYSYAWMNIIDAKILKRMRKFPKGYYEDMVSIPTLYKTYTSRYFQSQKPYYYYRMNPDSTTQKAKMDYVMRDTLKMKYLSDSLMDFVDKEYFKMNYGMLIAQYFLLYMSSFAPETLLNFKATMNMLRTWKTKDPDSHIKLHPDTVKDFGSGVAFVNQLLLIFWKWGFDELLFFIRKAILFFRRKKK